MMTRALLGMGPTSSASDEPTLDQLLAEPIVQQLMRRDSVDEATIRHLLQETASARLASTGPRRTDALNEGPMPSGEHCSARLVFRRAKS
jgi:hypothetical protein